MLTIFFHFVGKPFDISLPMGLFVGAEATVKSTLLHISRGVNLSVSKGKSKKKLKSPRGYDKNVVKVGWNNDKYQVIDVFHPSFSR